jgi:CO dehydrogenase/acetyl-CoA synthase delta subunit
MAYKIVYFRAATQYAEVYWDDCLPDTRETARKGIRRNRVDYATIHDLDRDAKLIETVSVRS